MKNCTKRAKCAISRFSPKNAVFALHWFVTIEIVYCNGYCNGYCNTANILFYCYLQLSVTMLQ